MTTILVLLGTHLVAGGLGWWIGKKGAEAVKGDVELAVKDVQKKV